MLLGCCHCGTPSLSSTPSDPSISEPSVSESASQSVSSDASLPPECEACIGGTAPDGWLVTLSGGDCWCLSLGEFTVTRTTSLGPNACGAGESGSGCYWESTTKASTLTIVDQETFVCEPGDEDAYPLIQVVLTRTVTGVAIVVYVNIYTTDPGTCAGWQTLRYLSHLTPVSGNVDCATVFTGTIAINDPPYCVELGGCVVQCGELPTVALEPLWE